MTNLLSIQSILSIVQSSECSLAFWKRPQSNYVRFALDLNLDTSSQGTLTEGFYLLNFMGKRLSDGQVIRNQISGKAQLLQKSQNIAPFSVVFANKDYIEHFLQLQKTKKLYATDYFFTEEQAVNFYRKTDFLNRTDKIIRDIENRIFEKVVLSRSQKVNYPTGFNRIDYFIHLCHLYPDALISWVIHPKWGEWIGASPEVFLQSNERHFRTVALAGTKNQQSQPHEWTNKEKREQKFVSSYIADRLKKMGLEFTADTSETVAVGHLWHLNTNFYIAKNDHSFEDLVHKLIENLHPTPAVCGIPKNLARELLDKQESKNRELYSGILGWIDPKNQRVDLFVNLRCMRLYKDFCILHAGAGIVKGSVPEEEWKETEAKMQTLLKVIQKLWGSEVKD